MVGAVRFLFPSLQGESRRSEVGRVFFSRLRCWGSGYGSGVSVFTVGCVGGSGSGCSGVADVLDGI